MARAAFGARGKNSWLLLGVVLTQVLARGETIELSAVVTYDLRMAEASSRLGLQVAGPR